MATSDIKQAPECGSQLPDIAQQPLNRKTSQFKRKFMCSESQTSKSTAKSIVYWHIILLIAFTIIALGLFEYFVHHHFTAP